MFSGADFVDIGDMLAEARLIKSAEELDLLRLGGELAQIGAQAFLDALFEGATELAIASRAVAAMNQALAARRPTALSSSYAYCQTGLGTLTPHLHPTGREIRQGDLIALNVFPVVDGYCMELERTLILGEPTRQAQHALDTVTSVFETTKKAVGAGARMAEIDLIAQAALEEAGYGSAIRHGTGHAHGIMIGSAAREEFGELRHYNERRLAPSMVCSVEPGIYISDLGGFRHSDVMLVGPTHTECLTEFPVGGELTDMTMGHTRPSNCQI